MVTGHRRQDAASSDRSQPDYTFDFCGGHVAIDFTNTVSSRGADEHFNTYGDLVAWAEARGVVSKPDASRLRKSAAAHPDAARRAFAKAMELRESLSRVFHRLASGKMPPSDDLASVNRFVSAIYRDARLTVSSGRLLFDTSAAADSLDSLLVPVVRAAVDLLSGDQSALIGACADDTCGWVFLDMTRNRTRRWCVMKECGNRAKVRRFRERAQ